MKALLIDFNIETGERPGGINPRTDKGLICPSGWQNLDSAPAKEIRLIKDDRDLAQYENIEGITILKTGKEIDAAVEKNIPQQRYVLFSQELLLQHMKEKGLSIDELVGKTAPEIAEFGFKHNLAGVNVIKTRKLKEMNNQR